MSDRAHSFLTSRPPSTIAVPALRLTTHSSFNWISVTPMDWHTKWLIHIPNPLMKAEMDGLAPKVVCLPIPIIHRPLVHDLCRVPTSRTFFPSTRFARAQSVL